MNDHARVPRSILAASILVISSNPSFSATITAEARDVRIEEQIAPGDAERLATLVLSLNRHDACALSCLLVYINSEGGPVDEALKIGRFLRNRNARVLAAGDQCLSSCVFVLMAGVVRGADTIIGVHRPFLFAADQDQDLGQAYRETRSELEAYFDDACLKISIGSDVQ